MIVPPLYAIVDEEAAGRAGFAVPPLAAAYLAGGARLLQVRVKRSPGARFLEICQEVVALARAAGATVLVNDRADLAVIAGADGVHVGQEDVPASLLRQAFPGLGLIGLSTHDAAELADALRQPVDYVAVGPVFATLSKAAARPVVGLEFVREAAATIARAEPDEARRRPLVAIGGITLDRAEDVLAAGASSVAVISDLLATGDAAGRVRAYLERLSRHATRV